MAVRVVTDSTSDLPGHIVESLGVTVVPCIVSFGQDSYLDGVEMDPAAFFERLASASVFPKTSQPPVEAFRETYEALGANGDDIVSIHVSSRLSGTMNSASIAREDISREIHIELIDSYSTSLGLGAIVVEAAEVAKAGGTLDEVTAAARRAMDRTDLAVALDTFEYLQRGGRIGRAKAMLGTLLSTKPLIRFEGGEVVPLGRVRTWKKAIARLEELATEHPHAKRMYIVRGVDDDEARSFIERIRPTLPHTEFILCQFGPVLGAHTGPHTLAVVWVERD